MNKFFIIFFALFSFSELFLSENSSKDPLDYQKEYGAEIPEYANIPSENYTPPKTAPSYAVIFRSFDRATLSAEITSTVQKITHRMGESFEIGELLILLDDTIFQGLLYKARASLDKAKAELGAKEKLYKENIASHYELKTAQANVATAMSDVINAKHAIKACHIIAPYNGKVVQLFVEDAELIREGNPLIEIVNDEQLIGQVLVPANATNLSRIALGTNLKIEVTETGETVMGKILRVSPVIDPASSLIKIDIVVDNKEEKLKSGMIGSITLENDIPNVSQKLEIK